ncbi:M15 family metallopeptidase [Deinococcus wulumuqiensis]|uniref:Peptidase M15C domain-containing protein n=1 Tax=Deinococcus wulumuqiensis TaxID=980427 RepID=A0AAV4K6H9_9DEIO|nr:M15 family metallopeptidase [Deinococcus wulumuqiensis]QII20072.1 M15 family metallopeptidase [Deinococcus wulumuqiensis R12]GGI87386.1 hypothetical protein GCM10010914_22340 [Deinococcus wulumuqiensis]GGP30007.1 hypothetical protein GCM10008021_16580 [Deinococcus wulumuqiensis]
MSNFDFAAAIAARPSGATKGQLVAAYGDPTQGCTRTGKGRFEPSAAFRRNMVKIPLSELPGFPDYAVPGTKISGVTFHRSVAPVFVATWAELHRRGLTGRLRTYDGATTYRHMLWNYSNPVSLHAYGAAIDFDARWNGYGIPHNQMQIDRDVVKCFEECGWEWGGRWGRSDGMHFQWTDPLPGVRQPEWRDAMAAGAPPKQRPTPAPPPDAVPGTHYLYGRCRVPYPKGQLVQEDAYRWASVATDAQGRVLLGPDGLARVVLFDDERATKKGLVK